MEGENVELKGSEVASVLGVLLLGEGGWGAIKRVLAADFADYADFKRFSICAICGWSICLGLLFCLRGLRGEIQTLSLG
jgi:hypothetical protein